jgi:hypothetical protein
MDEIIPVNKEKKKREELRRIKELSDLRKLFSLPECRRVYWKLMSRAGAFRTPYTGENNSTNFNCGLQSMGFFMLDELLEASPSTFTQMQREAKSESKKQEEEDREEQ